MSAILAISAAHNQLRLAASRAGADDHATAHSYIDLFDTDRPNSLDDVPGAPACVRITLAKPCGSIFAGVLALIQQDPDGDLIAVSSSEGGVKWGRWYAASGAPWADGDVTDEAGDGFFQLAGTSGTRVFAGGRAVLGLVALT